MTQPDPWPSAHPAPRRVVDGVLSETLRRPVWCLVEESLPVAPLAALLAGRARVVALLSEAAEDRAGEHPRLRSVEQVCTHLGVSPADVTLVCTDPDTDLVRFPADGARVVVVGDRAGVPRGMLVVRDAAELSGLFDQLTTYRTTSTYHEV